MSNEITVNVGLAVNNPPLVESWSTSGQFNQTTGVMHPDELSIPTTAGGTAIPIGAVASGSEGVAKFQNLDQTNYCDLGLVVSATFYPFARLYPGSNGNGGIPAEFCFSPGVTIYAMANTATVKIRELLLQL